MKLLDLRSPKVVVVGSTLIDTVATRPIDHKVDLHKQRVAEAKITQSFGGSAYNIAVNLGIHDVAGGVGLYTFLLANSNITDLITDRLARTIRRDRSRLAACRVDRGPAAA